MASKRHIRRRACEGKRHFLTYAEALDACDRYTSIAGLVPYACPVGDHYHLATDRSAIRADMQANGRRK